MSFLKKRYQLIFLVVLSLFFVGFYRNDSQEVSTKNQSLQRNVKETLSQRVFSILSSLANIFSSKKELAQVSIKDGEISSLEQTNFVLDQSIPKSVQNKGKKINNKKSGNEIFQKGDKDKKDNPSGLFKKDFSRALPEGLLGEDYCIYLNPLWGEKPYLWQWVAGDLPEGMSLDPINGMYCGKPAKAGIWSFTIKIKDTSGDFIYVAYSQTILTFQPKETSGNLAINACPESSLFVGVDYVAQLSAAGGKIPYVWNISGLPPGLTFDHSYGLISGAPLEEGQSSFNITVIDQNSTEASLNCSLWVQTSPLFLTSNSCPDGLVGDDYYCQMAAQGGEPPYSWQITSGIIPEGLIFNTQTAKIFGVPLKAQTEKLMVQVKDIQNKTDSAELSVNIKSEDLKITTPELESGSVGLSYYETIQALGGAPAYTWNVINGNLPTGIEFQDQNTNGGILIGTPIIPFEGEITFQVTDANNKTDAKPLKLTIKESPLKIVEPSSSIKGEIGDGLTIYFQAEGGVPFQDEPHYLWNLISGQIPKGLTFLPEGIMTGVPQEPLTADIAVSVTDSVNKTDSQEFEIKIEGEKLEIVTEELPCGFYSEEYNYLLEAKGGLPGYIWKSDAQGLASGLTLSSEGQISGIPKEIEKTAVSIEVKDQANNQDSKNFNLSIIKRIKITSENLPSAEADQDYRFSILSEGGEPPYHWSIVSGGIPGLKLDEDEGVLYGTPTDSGKFPLTVEVRSEISGCGDLSNVADVKEFSLEIAATLLAIRENECPGGNVGASYECLFEAQGGVKPYIWEVKSGELPEGLQFKTLETGQGEISGTPQESGQWNFTVSVMDKEKESAIKPMTLEISSGPLEIQETGCPNGQLGVSYECQLNAEGGVLPYTWSMIAGEMPKGLQLNSQTALISGTPTEKVENAQFSIELKDKLGQSDQTQIRLSIEGEDINPVTNLIARGSDVKIGLAWNNPVSSSYDHTEIYRSTSTFPQKPTDGTKIYSGTADNIVDTGLDNNTLYYYSAFAFDRYGNFASLTEESKISTNPHRVSVNGSYRPFIDEVVSYQPLDPTNAEGSNKLPDIVLGPPKGLGESRGCDNDIVSLHAKGNNDAGVSAPYGGTITLRFKDNIVVNGQGVDFTIFENAFKISNTDSYWMEPAIVEVSIDGKKFYQFPFDFVPHYDADGNLDLGNPYIYAKGFAGIKPVCSNNGTPDPTIPGDCPNFAGGDSFDLSDISSSLSWIQYVRITSTGDNWMKDINGDYVRHNNDIMGIALSGTYTSGFDLDAVAAVHY